MNQPADERSSRLAPGGILSAALGLALFIYFVDRAGLDEIARGVGKVGWGFGIILLFSGLRYVMRAAAWSLCVGGPPRLRRRDAVQAVLAGDTLGNLTPLGLVVSEPAKALFVRDRVPLVRALSALAVENVFYTLSVFAMIAAGLVALFLNFRVPRAWWLAGATLIATFAALGGLAHAILSRRLPLASRALDWLSAHALASRTLDARRPHVRIVETRIFDLYAGSRRRLLPLALLEGAFHMLGVAEVYVALALISGAAPTLLEAFVFESANRFITAVFKFVPLRIGVDEAGTGVFAELLRYGTAAGVTLAIVRKARLLVWMAVGTLALVRRGLSPRAVAHDPELAAVIRDSGSALRQAQGAPSVSRGGVRGSSIVIAVMARSPTGATTAIKTRLAASVPDEGDRLALYRACLADTIGACRRVPGAALRVAYTPDGGRDGFAAFGVRDDELVPQRGRDLGERERHLFEDLFAAGFSTAFIVGSDLPTLPPEHLAEAIGRLGDTARTVVLGPSEDGGYYLMGLRGAEVPDLFSDIRWSTPDALEDTVRAAERAGWRVATAPAWYDVDDERGLERLRAALRERPERAPATAAVLQNIKRKT